MLAAAAGLALAVTAPASATTLARTAVVCPVCDHAFEAVVIHSTDNGGGISRDLFARAVGAQPVHYLIATCTRCYYSGYVDDFQDPDRVTPALKEKILRRPRLKPPSPIKPDMDQRDIPATTRYALAERVYRWRNAPPQAMAWLYLRWAWVVRDDGSYLPPSLDLMEAMREIQPRLPENKRGNQADRELQAVTLLLADLLEGRGPPQQKPCLRLTMAMILRRHGENRQAEPLLRGLLDQGGLEPKLQRAAQRMLDSIREERRLLALARDSFELALKRDEIKPDNRGPARYLLGELCRRLGDDDAARGWFDAALADASLDNELRRWAEQQRAAAAPVDWLPPATR